MQPLKVALLQAATHWHDPAANRQMFAELLDTVPADAHLVLLPEMFSTGFTMASAEVAETMEGPTVSWMRTEAAAREQVLCGSVVIRADDAFYNRFLWVPPDGVITFYDKRHRFRMAGEHEHYSAGSDRVLVTLRGWRLCPMVCYDLRFPVWLRNRGDYDALLCVANWPAARQTAWNTLLRARAIENQVYLAAVNIVGMDGNNVSYSGGSAAFAPDGAVLVERFDEPGVLVTEFDPARLAALRAEFPVGDDADDFVLTLE